MLRVSATTTQTEINIQAVVGDAEAAAQGIEFGPELAAFAEAVARRDPVGLETSRDQLLSAAGAPVLVDAAGVAANFQRMVRIADAIGIPVDDMTSELGQEIRTDLNLQSFPGAKHSLTTGTS